MFTTQKIRITTLSLFVVLVASCSQTAQDPYSNHRQDMKQAAEAKAATSSDSKSFENREKDPVMTASTHYAAGRLAEIQGDSNRAIEHYWAAVKLEPGHRGSLFRLGVVYSQLKHYPDAAVAWKLYIKSTGGSADAYSNLAFCYELAGKPNEAEEAYKKGLAQDPKSNACRVNYGLMLARDGKISEATIQFQAVLTPSQVHYNLASVYEHQGKREQAKEEYRRAIAADPGCVDAALRMAALN